MLVSISAAFKALNNDKFISATEPIFLSKASFTSMSDPPFQ